VVWPTATLDTVWLEVEPGEARATPLVQTSWPINAALSVRRINHERTGDVRWMEKGIVMQASYRRFAGGSR
jgi:hypothetical protein